MGAGPAGGWFDLRRRIRSLMEPLGLDGLGRRAFVELGLLGERARRLTHGPASPGDAILLVAGGRSGSTWIADVLSACGSVQQLFEPLHPTEVAEVGRLTGWTQNDRPHIRQYYLRPGAEHPEWDTYLERMLTGRVRNYWTDVVRTSWLPSRYLVKVIRANLMVGHVLERFSPRVVFVVRHPCAVVSSRLSAGWHADVRDLLDQEELVEDHLRPWLREIEAERDLLGAHAVWWAVESRVSALQLAGRPHVFDTYEAILADPLARMTAMAEAVALSSERLATIELERPSRMASAEAAVQGMTPALSQRWRERLDDEQVRRVLVWAERLGVRWYDEAGRPTVASGTAPTPDA